jgi:uncharacterized protein (DUF58 family)
MKLTRRGRVAVAVVVLSMVLGLVFGARSLNAIAAPTLAALVVSAVLVSRSDPPTASLSSVDAGFPGEARRLTLELSGTGLAAVSLALPERVDGETDVRQVTLPHSVSYDLELTGRGVHKIGPPEVALRGPLGLFERETSVEGTAEVTVYPDRYTVEGGSILSRLFVDELEAERQEFDRLREYRPGDPLRHIHWKSSAKHEEFLVTEFAPSERDETVTILGTAPKGEVDEMARLAATIADLAFEAGYKVELATPTGHVPPGQGDAHRENVLQLLAQTTRGTIAPLGSEEADIEITYAQRELVVRIGAEEFTVPQLLEHVDVVLDEDGEDTTAEATTDAGVTP